MNFRSFRLSCTPVLWLRRSVSGDIVHRKKATKFTEGRTVTKNCPKVKCPSGNFLNGGSQNSKCPKDTVKQQNILMTNHIH